MTNNLIIAILTILAVGETAIIFEANRAKYWSNEQLSQEVFTAYNQSCTENTKLKHIAECEADANEYVRLLVLAGHGNQ